MRTLSPRHRPKPENLEFLTQVADSRTDAPPSTPGQAKIHSIRKTLRSVLRFLSGDLVLSVSAYCPLPMLLKTKAISCR
jgi:hypothetical protein